MAKKIQGTDIIEDNHLANPIQQAEELLKVYKALDDQIRKTAKDIKKISGGADGGAAQGIQQINNAVQQSNKLRKSSIEVDKQKLQLKKQLDAATDEQVKGQLRLQAVRKKQRDILKDEIALENKQVGTLKRLQIENRQLRREREGLNLETQKGRKRLKEINASLDRNNAKIKANSDAMKRQRLNVGAYGKAVSRVSGILKGFGATLVAAFSFQAIKSFFKGSIEAFQQQEKAVAKVEQALKSTQNAAGKTLDELKGLASDLQGTTLFGDEEILNNATAQLLTFTNIAGDNFDRTQKVALDLATVLDGDLKSASIQLGKALNDPIANLSALSRSGIQFSAEQKELIKTLTESGKLAEAQSVILDELERQYGGQAEAAAQADGGLTQLSNAFGDFKEQVGKTLLEALKPMIQSLKEFFEGLTQDDINTFIDNIVRFGKVILKAAGIFASYKVAVNAATKVNKLFSTNLPTKSFGALGAAITGVIFVITSLIDHYRNAATEGEALRRVNEKVNDQMDEQIVKLDILFMKAIKAGTGTEKRKQALDEINSIYGTTLQNLDDEAAFLTQLEEAYKSLVTQMQKRIQLQVVENELVEFTTELRKTERELNGDISEQNKAILNEKKRFLEGEIKSLQKELILLQQEEVNQQDMRNNMRGEAVDLNKKLVDEDVDNFKKGEEDKTDALRKEWEKRQDILRKFRRIEKLEQSELIVDSRFGPVDPFTNAMILANEEMAKIRQERLDELQQMREDSLRIFKEITDGLTKNIDERIAERQREIDESASEITRLQDLAAQGNVDAAEAIKAERIAQAQEKLEIEALEKKKRNLLIVVTALEKANQNLNAGDNNAFKNATSAISGFLAGLPQFYGGTQGTIAEALGGPMMSGRDGYVVRVDGSEKVLNPRQSALTGSMTTDEITRAALAYQNNLVSTTALGAGDHTFTDAKIVSELQEVKQAIKGMEITQQHIDILGLKETIKKANKIITNDYNPPTFRA